MKAWQTCRLKYLVGINERTLSEDTPPDRSFRYLDIGSVGRGALTKEPDWITFESAPSRARRLVRAGDTIVSTVRTYLRAIWPVDGDADDLVVSTGFAVLSPRHQLEPRFLGWWAQSDLCVEEIVARSVGVSYPAINPSAIGDLLLALPPYEEQRRIADFLDVETSRIDALIKRKRRLINLAAERTSALVTKLIFDQPSPTWARLARLVDLLPGYAFPSESFLTGYVENGVRLLRGINVVPGRVRWDETIYLSGSEAASLSRFALAAGDLVIGMDRPLVGSGMRVAELTPADVPSLLVQRVARVRVTDIAHRDYVRFALQSDAFVAYFTPIVTGVSVPHISPDQIMSFRLPLPASDVQESIASRLIRQERDGTELSSRLRKQIDLLTEHRRALITAAVTGRPELVAAA